MNKKGFTVIELLASFTLTMIITVFLFQVVLELKDIYWSINLKTRVLDKNAIVATTLNNYFKNNCTDGSICYSSNIASLNTSNRTISIGSKNIQMPDKTEIKSFSTTGGSLTTTSNGSDNAYVTIKYKIESQYLEKPIEFNYVNTFVGTVNNSDSTLTPTTLCPSGTVDGGDGYCYSGTGYLINGTCYTSRSSASYKCSSGTQIGAYCYSGTSSKSCTACGNATMWCSGSSSCSCSDDYGATWTQSPCCSSYQYGNTCYANASPAISYCSSGTQSGSYCYSGTGYTIGSSCYTTKTSASNSCQEYTYGGVCYSNRTSASCSGYSYGGTCYSSRSSASCSGYAVGSTCYSSRSNASQSGGSCSKCNTSTMWCSGSSSCSCEDDYGNKWTQSPCVGSYSCSSGTLSGLYCYSGSGTWSCSSGTRSGTYCYSGTGTWSCSSGIYGNDGYCYS